MLFIWKLNLLQSYLILMLIPWLHFSFSILKNDLLVVLHALCPIMCVKRQQLLKKRYSQIFLVVSFKIAHNVDIPLTCLEGMEALFDSGIQ